MLHFDLIRSCVAITDISAQESRDWQFSMAPRRFLRDPFRGRQQTVEYRGIHAVGIAGIGNARRPWSS